MPGFWTGEALTLRYYRDASLRAVGERRSCAQRRISQGRRVLVAQWRSTSRALTDLRVVVDFVDVDSAKWSQYAQIAALAAVGGLSSAKASACLRSSAQCRERAERERLRHACRSRSLSRRGAGMRSTRPLRISNGVDTDYFAPSFAIASPFGADEEPIVFTGAMDYWPNVDAVCWFAHEVLPRDRGATSACAVLRRRDESRRPRSWRWHATRASSSPDGVADVRPYLQHARVVVAPLRVARGIQNKVLEAMAMGRPVVASATCGGGADCAAGGRPRSRR